VSLPGSARAERRGSAAFRLACAAIFPAFVFLAPGCAIIEPADEAFLSSRTMRFDDRDPDRDISGEIGAAFGSFPGGGDDWCPS
jgi:hypothetical protein